MKDGRVHLMVGTPCYGGMVHEGYLRGLTSLVAEVAGSGSPINLATVVNESLITRARNELVKHFLISDCTHLLFIDSDICFEPNDVYRIVSHDKDLVVASYPLKGQRWENLSGMTEIKDPEEVKRRVIDHVVNFKFNSEEDLRTGRVDIKEGLVEVHEGGTGFMCIKRHVVEKIIEANPDTKYKKEPRFLLGDHDDGERWAIFDTEIEENGRYLSEDYLFCRRWQRLGGQVWLDPFIELTHMGTYAFQGHKLLDMDDPLIPQSNKSGLIGGR
jgi:hypothetical protein